ncbi:MAG: hypothetical protein GF334_01505 [Candidatus Altiarchaeales archaeon]|nr:hypothetical protein [Candidatus Altiarchaeales archaeon]
MSEILGFGSTAQVGKDTAANHLEEVFGEAKRVAFADKLKQVAMLLFGLSYEQCYGPVEIKEKVDPRYNLTPREILQGIGENMRKVYEDIWIDTVFNTTIPDLEQQGYSKFVISDVRYPNEARKITKEGGAVVRIDREGSGVSVGKGHSSETAMEDYKDYTAILKNNGTLEEFFASVEALVEELGWQKLKEETEQVQKAEA